MKKKIDLASFIEQARINCPLSTAETVPMGFYEHIFNSVTANSFFTPGSRSLIEEGYNIYNKTEVGIRLSGASMTEPSEAEFIASADLTNKQLFHYSNSLAPPPTLIPLALRHLLAMLTQRYVKYALATSGEGQAKFSILSRLVTLNKRYQDLDQVDKLFQVMYKVAAGNKQLEAELETLLWSNFECLKRSLVLLPRLSMPQVLRGEVREALELAFASARRLIAARAVQ